MSMVGYSPVVPRVCAMRPEAPSAFPHPDPMTFGITMIPPLSCATAIPIITSVPGGVLPDGASAPAVPCHPRTESRLLAETLRT